MKPERATAGKAARELDPPPALLQLIGVFLTSHGFKSTGRAFKAERQQLGHLVNVKDSIGDTKLPPKLRGLEHIYKEWLASAHPNHGAERTKSAQKDVSETSSSGGSSSSTDDSASDSSDEAIPRDSITKSSTKFTNGAVKDSSLSSSEADSDSDSADVKIVKSNPIKLAKDSKTVATPNRTAKQSLEKGSNGKISPNAKAAIVVEDSSSDASSSDPSSSESEAPPKKTKVNIKEPKVKGNLQPTPVQKPSVVQASSGSSSDSSSEDSSESDSEQEANQLKPAVAKNNKPAVAGKTNSTGKLLKKDFTGVSTNGITAASTDSSSSEDSSSDSDVAAANTKTAATAIATTSAKRKRSPSPKPSQKKQTEKILKKTNAPFQRIPSNVKVDPRLASNAYVSYDYADRAHRDLVVTKGKGFTKEKNKKKRGSYRGGVIDISGGRSIKFED